jgi:hypothetical protein
VLRQRDPKGGNAELRSARWRAIGGIARHFHASRRLQI